MAWMEIKLPEELEAAMAHEISLKPGMDRRTYVLEAIRRRVLNDQGYRRRSANKAPGTLPFGSSLVLPDF
jgi:hypothetical protein